MYIFKSVQILAQKFFTLNIVQKISPPKGTHAQGLPSQKIRPWLSGLCVCRKMLALDIIIVMVSLRDSE